MQRLQSWVRAAADASGRLRQQQQQQQQEDDGDDVDFIYGRIAVHSDDEDAGPHNKPKRPSRRVSAPDHLQHSPHQQQLGSEQEAAAAAAAAAGQQQHDYQHAQHLPPLDLAHQHCHSDGELQKVHSASQRQLTEQLVAAQQQQQQGCSGGWADTGDDWANFEAAFGAPQQPEQQQQHAAGASSSSGGWQQQQHHSRHQQHSAAAEAAAAAAAGGSSEEFADDEGGSPSAAGAGAARRALPDDFTYDEDVPDFEHTAERRELLIYAIPLTRDKVIFLPVCPWRTGPEESSGWKGAVAGHVRKVQGEATDVWQKMAAAEQGSVVHRLYKLGKRVLDSVPAEERLMRGVPKNISKVIIRHPSQVSPETIMEQMQTMTKSYGIKAVGRAAAATVMLPLAVGVDLIILPGPQVLTYYTMWTMYRNTNGALGTTRMTRFITQDGKSENIRVNYAVEPRLDRYFDLARDCPQGVLTEDDIEGLVEDLREPDLLDALMSLRNKALGEAGRRTSKAGDEYVSLPAADPLAAASGFGSSSGQQQPYQR